ncbi:hypothetical protein [Microbacterium sp. NPDC089696]|uniref:hypothetical protein n=1 Tax=Microbacterium sp. NPDC089696 TaxID=3364199 RepID=UPI00380F9480
MSGNPMEFPLSPQELGVFKSRLADDPSDDEARTALVSWYRQNGHNDQAGRYAIAIDGAATADEVRAYSSMLRGLRADDRRMRELSRLPDDAELLARVSEQLSSALKITAPGSLAALIERIAAVLWLAFAVSVLLTLGTTFVVTLQGDTAAPEIASGWSSITLAFLAAACIVAAIGFAVERMWVGAVIMSAISVGAAWAVIALLSG